MRGVLFSQMEPHQGCAAEFHRWYETEHIPARLRLRGFSGATRWVAVVGEPAFLAVYELRELSALETPEYRRLKSEPSAETARMLGNVSGFTRVICAELSDSGPALVPAEFLSVVAFAVPPEREAAFDEWYETEHEPLLLQAGDWLRIRRFQVLSGEGLPWTRMALHELQTLDVTWAVARDRARRGPKRAALAREQWFAGAGRWLYRVLTRHVAGGGHSSE